VGWAGRLCIETDEVVMTQRGSAEMPERWRINGKSDREALAIWLFVALGAVAVVALLIALSSDGF